MIGLLMKIVETAVHSNSIVVAFDLIEMLVVVMNCLRLLLRQVAAVELN